ncbi:MAG: hypothetical protein FWH52_01690 [Synergistaceae bacterium]|nr:hypothetical protein [Synergistaceae bacterium]
METLMIIYSNPTEESREDEFNNWYTWVHIRDVMSLEGSIAVQRFELDSHQPENPFTTCKYLALYEIASKDACSQGHADRLLTWRMRVSTAFDFPSHIEGYWDPVHSTADFAEYADYKGDKAVLIVRIKAKGSEKVEDILAIDTLNKIAGLPGFVAAHLNIYAKDQMATTLANPPEPMSHTLVCQLSDSAAASAAWDGYLNNHPAIWKGLKFESAMYKPVIDRFKACDRIKSPEWRAISFLSHAILGLVGEVKPEDNVSLFD